MTRPRIALIWPPAGSSLGPPFGVAALAGHLRVVRPTCELTVSDLSIRVVRRVLAEVPAGSEFHCLVAERWTQDELVQDALSRWAFGAEAPAGVGALPDWKAHYLALFLGEVLDGYVESVDPPDLVGLSVCRNGLIASIGLTRRLKRRFPETRLVWGGPSASEMQAASLLRLVPEIDAVVVGEGEAALVALVDALPGLPGSDIPGIVTRDSTRPVVAQIACYLPSEPAFDVFDLSLYPALELPMSIGRGCGWGRCSFCNENYVASPYQAVDPVRSARWALDWQARHRPVSFDLVDSAANWDSNAFGQFVAELEAGGGLRQWRCMMRTTGLCREALRRAMATGLHTVYFGLESLDDGVLEQMQKGATVAHHLRALRIALELGLQVEADLILHFPADTPEAVRRSIDMVRRQDHLFARVSISFSRFVPSLRSLAWSDPAAFGIRLLPYSQRLARHLPPTLAEGLLPSDPHWEFVDDRAQHTRELSRCYLELIATLTQLRQSVAIKRTWYVTGSTTVLESFDEQSRALDRVFLYGKQREIWHALTEPRSTRAVADGLGIDEAAVVGLTDELANRGFVDGGATRTITALETRSRTMADGSSAR